MEKYFEKFISNTYASGANQLHFATEGVRTSRAFYKIAVGGEYDYSLLFTNVIDSTYSDGSLCRANVVCKPWDILAARVGKS